MRTFLATVVSIACLIAVAGRIDSPTAAARELISLPGVPGVPNPNNVIKGAAVQQAENALNQTIFNDAPIRSSADKVYPTVSTLPGSSFASDSVGRRVSVDRNGALMLSPGDYTLSVQTFCMKISSHSPQSNIFRLAPLVGKWADIIAAAQSRAVAAGIPHQQIQVLSWQLQAGLKYQELSPRSKALVDSLIPEFRSRLNESLYEEITGTWNKVSSTLPGVPSLDSMLDQLGDAGRFIRQLEFERATLLSYADDYNSVARLFVQQPQAHAENVADTLWSVVGDRVYARMVNSGTYLGPGLLEIRVLPSAHASRVRPYQVASMHDMPVPFELGDGGARVPFPVGGDVGVPGADVQPLGIAPEAPTPGPSSSPTPSCDTPAYGSGDDGVPGGNPTFQPYDAKKHGGIDVGAPRDTPVYADLQQSVPVDSLNAAQIFKGGGSTLHIPETGDLKLAGATVWVQPWTKPGDDYGGIIRLQVQYQADSGKTYSFNVDYLHLITKDLPPKRDNGEYIDNNGHTIERGQYNGCQGFGPQMKPWAKLSAEELAKHPLIGYLGATQQNAPALSAHVHIQAGYGGQSFDPTPLLASN